jgi:hypothetical protein
MRRMKVIAAALALVLLGCGDNTGPAGVPDAQLSIVRQDTLAPPLLSTQASFWAKVGDGREVRLNYQGAAPGDTGKEYLRFEVPGDGLYRKPDGSAFLPDDSIFITVTVVDPTRFHYEFEPSGLRFSPNHPARLKIEYLHGQHDFNADGVEDAEDVRIEGILDLWERSGPGAPWFRLGAVKFEDLDELDANILSFTEHAVAW